MLCLNGSRKQDLWASLLYCSLLETEAQSPCDSHSGRLQIETALQTVCVQWILTGFFSLGCDVQSDCRRPCRNNSWWILRRKHIQPNNDKIIHYIENTFLKKYSRFIDIPWSNQRFIIHWILKIKKTVYISDLTVKTYRVNTQRWNNSLLQICVNLQRSIRWRPAKK